MNICVYCNSEKIHIVQIRKNLNSEKPVYRCKECNRRFSIDDGFKKFRHPPVMIKTAISLLEQGFSLGQTLNYINNNFRVRLTRKTIYDWKKRFIKGKGF